MTGASALGSNVNNTFLSAASAAAANNNSEGAQFLTNKQRVGSFRSRLKKQQPIMMSEPPLGTVSPATSEVE